jgi:hypothetical protein
MVSARTPLLCLFFAAASTLGGCGTMVPEIQEIYENQEQGKTLVQQIITNITCGPGFCGYSLRIPSHHLHG